MKNYYSISPGSRAWLRFKRNKRGFVSLWIFAILFFVSLFAEFISNDRPIVLSYNNGIYVPVFFDYPETVFGGDFLTATDYLDPFIKEKLTSDRNWVLYPLNNYSHNSLNYFSPYPNPAAPSGVNWLGTDDRGRDVLARLIYGFRVSVLFGLCLTFIGVLLGILMGAVQGYFAGKTDLIIHLNVLHHAGHMYDKNLIKNPNDWKKKTRN